MHLDMDAFFAAVEQLDNPALRGRPVLVGSDRPRGVVATASYEARPFGCHSAQPMAVARRQCPQAVIVPARFARYREMSQRMFGILEAFTTRVEPLSIDEAFLDVTGCAALAGRDVATSPEAKHGRFAFAAVLARRMKDRIRAELGLTASVGVAGNKFLAKLASDYRKPDGLTVVASDGMEAWLGAMPVGKVWGIGPKSVERLAASGVRTVSDLRGQGVEWMRRQFGGDAERYAQLARGQDERPVTTDDEAKSISQEQTFEVDLTWAEEVRHVLRGQVEEVAYRVRKHAFHARVVTLKLRSGDFKTITRSTTLEAPTDQTEVLWRAARELYDAWAERSFHPVRLIGMAAKDFSAGPGQLSLFADPASEKQSRLDKTLDQIRAKFGRETIRRGGG